MVEPARAILARGVGQPAARVPLASDRCRQGDAELLGHLLSGIEEADRKSATAHARARFGANADLQAGEAQAQDELAERYRGVAKDVFGIAFPGVDPARFVRTVFP